MAKDLAREIGYIYIDSGAMYRAVTLYCLRHGLFHGDEVDTDRLKTALLHIDIAFKLNPETGKPQTYLDGTLVENDIRTLAVSSKVSIVAALGFVREAMVSLQQQMGREKGIVMDGRDIRAQRRYDELQAKGEKGSYQEILENVKERDRIDTSRAVSPLRKADDAIELDNSHMTISEQKEWLAARFRKAAGAE